MGKTEHDWEGYRRAIEAAGSGWPEWDALRRSLLRLIGRIEGGTAKNADIWGAVRRSSEAGFNRLEGLVTAGPWGPSVQEGRQEVRPEDFEHVVAAAIRAGPQCTDDVSAVVSWAGAVLASLGPVVDNIESRDYKKLEKSAAAFREAWDNRGFSVLSTDTGGGVIEFESGATYSTRQDVAASYGRSNKDLKETLEALMSDIGRFCAEHEWEL